MWEFYVRTVRTQQPPGQFVTNSEVFSVVSRKSERNIKIKVVVVVVVVGC